MAVGISGEKKLTGNQFKDANNLGKGRVKTKAIKSTLPTPVETQKETKNQAIARRKKLLLSQQQ